MKRRIQEGSANVGIETFASLQTTAAGIKEPLQCPLHIQVVTMIGGKILHFHHRSKSEFANLAHRLNCSDQPQNNSKSHHTPPTFGSTICMVPACSSLDSWSVLQAENSKNHYPLVRKPITTRIVSLKENLSLFSSS